MPPRPRAADGLPDERQLVAAVLRKDRKATAEFVAGYADSKREIDPDGRSRAALDRTTGRSAVEPNQPDSRREVRTHAAATPSKVKKQVADDGVLTAGSGLFVESAAGWRQE
jgi:hypothetical protein